MRSYELPEIENRVGANYMHLHICRNKLGKKSIPKYPVFFLRITSKSGYFVVITIYNLLFWELNFTNTKASL